MKKNALNQILLSFILLMIGAEFYPVLAQELYLKPKNKETRWYSFENINGEKGAGGMENNGAKGHPDNQLKAGSTLTLLDVNGNGVIHRIWMTVRDRRPEMLRSLTIDMYWDNAEKPAVSVPLGDFFGVGLGLKVPFESNLFSDPEGRSFNCFVPMPFKTGAKITITNNSNIDLTQLYYDVNLVKGLDNPDDCLYFHAYWNRELKTELGKDFEILPRIEGNGRFLGTNVGVMANPIYEGAWWGEGEVKMFLDQDKKYPTLVGTGTEDYYGSAWNQGTFHNQYQGSLISNNETGQNAFYRYHIPDPIYFHESIRVTIQQMGGASRDKAVNLMKNGVPLIPVSVYTEPKFGFIKLLEMQDQPNLQNENFPKGTIIFYRQDDVSATAYFYLDKPTNNLPKLQSIEVRTANLIKNE